MKVENRIKKHADFDLIIKTGKLFKSNTYSIYIIPSINQYTRIGIAVGKKNGNAVLRVKIKRQIRAVLASDFSFKPSLDVIIIVKSNYDVGKFDLNKIELVGLLGKIEDYKIEKH